MAQIFQRAEFVTPDTQINIIENDPSDNKFLEAALAGQAIYVVSGDKHLLELGSYQGVRMITARKFLSYLDKET